jgi:23S rRNA (pseudouridine1915-N3)-methyltransferase
MNVALIAVDRLREPYLRAGCALYVKRLARYAGIAIVEVRKASGADGPAQEGRDILARVTSDDAVWVLDRTGDDVSSEDLAARLGLVERSGRRRLAVVIGGPEGLHASVLERADFRWSLSRQTFLHEMARLIALEQLYRAFKIARGEPYHR